MSWWDTYGPAACVVSFGAGYVLAMSICLANIKQRRAVSSDPEAPKENA